MMQQRSVKSCSSRAGAEQEIEVPRIIQISADLTKVENFYLADSIPPIMTGGVVKERNQRQMNGSNQQRVYNKFPPSLLAFAKVLPGNNSCPDCSLRKTPVISSCLTWAK